jgi:polyphosphate kinase 2
VSVVLGVVALGDALALLAFPWHRLGLVGDSGLLRTCTFHAPGASRMSKTKHHDDAPAPPSSASTTPIKPYEEELYDLRVQLVKLQNEVIRKSLRILVVLEGRDAAGKDGAIKRIVKNLSPRETRVVALGKPSDRDESTWYFQRYVPHLPAGGEMVLFNRSWYNRAGVEIVMGFCSPKEHEAFMEDAPRFEQLLVASGISLRKFYLDIDKAEQGRRLESRSRNPLEQWKLSPIDAVAVKRWDEYSSARDEMLARTHTPLSPWTIVRTNDKHAARINLMKEILASMDYKGKDEHLVVADPEVVFRYDVSKGRLAR